MDDHSSAAAQIWHSVTRLAVRQQRGANAQLAPWAINAAQAAVLLQVAAADGLIQYDVAARLGVIEGTVSQLVEKLEQRGLLRRYPEGRIKRLALTAAGREVVAAIRPVHDAVQAAQCAGLSPREQQQLVALLRKLDRAHQQASTNGQDR